jgi:hypothetical protein
VKITTLTCAEPKGHDLPHREGKSVWFSEPLPDKPRRRGRSVQEIFGVPPVPTDTEAAALIERLRAESELAARGIGMHAEDRDALLTEAADALAAAQAEVERLLEHIGGQSIKRDRLRAERDAARAEAEALREQVDLCARQGIRLREIIEELRAKTPDTDR